MVCSALGTLGVFDGRLDCTPSLAPLILLAAVTLMVGVGLILRRGSGWAPAVLTILAATALAFSAQRPVWVAAPPDRDDARGLVVGLLDMSDSVWRSPAEARQAQVLLAERAGELAASLAGAGDWQGQVLEFASGVRSPAPEQPLSRLPDLIRATAPVQPGERSRGAEGIEAALERIRSAGGKGAILLMSDGHFDATLPEALLERSRAAGVPISILGTGADAPAAGLIAADLGPEQQLGQQAVVRATLLGGGRLTVRSGDKLAEIEVPDSTRARPARIDTRFDARGLRHVRLLHDGEGLKQERVLYTLVRGPSRVLAFGRAPWLDGLDPARWLVERHDPADAPAPGQFDLVVIDSLGPEAFPPGFAAAMRDATRRTGLFLVNGDLRGTIEQPQRIGDWNRTDLSAVLPVDSDPRIFVQEPPGRDIVILIDVSGSMGPSLGLGKRVARAVLDQLRPQDTVAILPFSSAPGRPFDRRPASGANVAAAREFVGRLVADGGTAPDSTLRRAAELRSNYCAFFFISDGGFDAPKTSPQCHTTAISTEGRRFPSGVAAWGQEILLEGAGGISGIRMQYFEPEERETFFRPGVFRAITAGSPAPFLGRSLNGVAIAYPRVDAEVLSLHSEPPPDPVLALRRDPISPGAATAVFLSTLPAGTPPAEVASLLAKLESWNDQERFDIRLRQQGDRLNVSVLTLSDGQAPQPLPEQLSGSLRLAELGAQPLAFRPAGAPGRFEASVTLSLGETAMAGELSLTEAGGRTQVIPIDLPPKGPARRVSGQGEALDFGVDDDALQRLAAQTGGVDLAHGGPTLDAGRPQVRKTPVHGWPIAVALVFLAGALWAQGRPD